MGSKSSDKSSSDLLPSTSTSFTTSTLLSKRFNNNNSSLSNNKKHSNRYNMGTVGRSCVNTIRRSRQNVAIATQVLSPSAIGGSLKGHREARHFGPPDDDEEGFITYRRSKAWRKLCYYGSAIVVVILLLMAIILGVGYMQSEKHKRILSRSVKLVQEKNPSSFIYVSTTPAPPSLEPTDSHEFFPTAQSSFLLSSGKEDSAENESTQNEFFFSSGESNKNHVGEDGDYQNYYQEEENNQPLHAEDDNTLKHENPILFYNNGDIVEDHDNESNNRKNNDSSKGESQEAIAIPSDKLDNDLDAVVVDNESVDDVNNNDDWKSIEEPEKTHDVTHNNEEVEHQLLLSEVKVLPPEDFVFSIEIPIYTPNKTTKAGDDANPSLDNQEVEQFATDDKNQKPTQSHSDTEPNESEWEDKHETRNEQLEGESKEVITEEVKGLSDTIDSRENKEPKYHTAVLHTALFNGDDDADTGSSTTPSASNEISPDGSEHSWSSNEEHVDLRYRQDDSGDDSEETIGSRSRGRNRKFKMLRDDKIVSLKATYNPPATNKPYQFIASEAQPRLDEKSFGKPHLQAQILRLYNEKHGVNHLLNKTSSKQRSRVSNNKDYVNIKDFILDTTPTLRRPLTSSTQQVSLSSKTPEGKNEVKPRLLSSSIPNFDIDFNTILKAQGLGFPESQPESKTSRAETPRATSDFGTNFALSLNQFLPPTAASVLPTPGLDSSQFSKRAFNEYDIDYRSFLTSAPTQNYFAHLLGQNPNAGTFGTASGAGAALNNIFPPLYTPSTGSFDTSSSSTHDNPALAPGTVPLDLASSYIQAGLPSPSSTPGQQSNPFNPYSHSGDTTPQFSFGNNNDKFSSASDGVGTLTTFGGQPPTYNTISQGMNLLNLISGTYPNSYFQDQVYQPTNQFSSLQQPQDSQSQFNPGILPFPSVGLPSFPQLNQNEYLTKLEPFKQQHQSVLPPPRNFNIFQATKEHRELAPSTPGSFIQRKEHSPVEFSDEEDQLPAASSFSQNILTTFQSPVIKKIASAIESSTLKNAIALITKPHRKNPNMDISLLKATQSEPKSFSFEILPGRGKARNDLPSNNAIDDTMNNLKVDIIQSTLDNFVSGSKSKKKASVSIEATNRKPSTLVLGSTGTTTLRLKSNLMNTKEQKGFEKSGVKPTAKSKLPLKIPSTTIRAPNNGLKSGFFTT